MQTDNREALLALGDQVVAQARKAGADVAEVSVREGAHLSTKVRRGEPELVEEAGSKSVGLRVMIGKQVAVSSTSDVSPTGLTRLVEDAVELARLSQPDEFAGPPDASLLSTSEQYVDLDPFDPNMHTLDAAEAIRRAKAGEQAAFDADERIVNSQGATFSRATGASALVTSSGFRAASRGTYASLSVVPVAEDEGGKNRRGSYWSGRRHIEELMSPEEVGAEAARRTLAKLGARKIATQEVPVIFDTDAARAMIGLLAGCVSGNSIWRRSSYLAGREGTQIASELVTIVDDPLIPRAPGSRAFDGEGLLARRNLVVEKGELKTYLMDSYAARKLGKESTASASRGSSAGVGISTSNFFMLPGEQSRDELIKSTKRALYVTEMMGFGFNAVTGDFSRGAAGFWVEDGEFAFPVSEVTISLNVDELFKRIDAVANDLEHNTSVVSPTFRVSSMTVAGT